LGFIAVSFVEASGSQWLPSAFDPLAPRFDIVVVWLRAGSYSFVDRSLPSPLHDTCESREVEFCRGPAHAYPTSADLRKFLPLGSLRTALQWLLRIHHCFLSPLLRSRVNYLSGRYQRVHQHTSSEQTTSLLFLKRRTPRFMDCWIGAPLMVP
jgi:hypothetical protein